MSRLARRLPAVIARPAARATSRVAHRELGAADAQPQLADRNAEAFAQALRDAFLSAPPEPAHRAPRAALAVTPPGDASVDADATSNGPAVEPAAIPGAAYEREPRGTAPADLLEVPETVAATADDFFGSLVRRVERRT